MFHKAISRCHRLLCDKFLFHNIPNKFPQTYEKKQQNGYRGAGFERGQASELFGRSLRYRETVSAHRGRSSRHRKTVSTHRGRSSRHRKTVSTHRGRSSRWREDLPNSSETLRDGARTFRTLRKCFATARGASELFGNASRRREDLPNSSETLRDGARTFQTLRKRFAASRNGSRTPRKGFPSKLPLPFGHLPLQKGEKN